MRRRVALWISFVLVATVGVSLGALPSGPGSSPLAPPVAHADPGVDAAEAIGLQPAAGQFVPLTPARVASAVSIAPNTAADVKVLGVGGVPAEGVSAVAVNLGALSTGAGNFTAFPTGITKPGALTLHYRPSLRARAFAAVKVGSNGSITVHNTTSGTVAATLDAEVHGYWLSAPGAAAQSTFVPLPTKRVDADPASANNYATIPDVGSVAFPVLGQAGVPSSGVTAVALSISAKSTAAPGYVTAFADGASTPPGASVQYESANVWRTNTIVSKLGANGQLKIYHNNTSTTTPAPAASVLVDVIGYFASPANATAKGSTFVPLNPARLATGVSIAGQGTYDISPLGAGGVPATGVSGVALTITASSADAGTTSAASGFLTAYPGPTRTSNGVNVAYEANKGFFNGPISVGVGTDGKVQVFNYAAAAAAPVKIWVDVYGYYKAPTAPAAPTNVKASAGDTEASVTWDKPTSDGSAAITTYTVTASPGGKAATVSGDLLTATVGGLTNNTAYTFTVKAKNAIGEGPASSPSNRTVPLDPGATYAHDANGRVTGVFDDSGAGSKISYDKAGNIASVDTLPADRLAIVQVSPPGAAVGDTVSIYGTGFGSDKAAVAVTFNGVAASPTSVGPNVITVQVPAGATAGEVKVTVGGTSASTPAFGVKAKSVPAVSLSGITLLDTGATLVLNGSGFDPDKTRNIVSINGTKVQVTAAAVSRLTLKLPADPVFGHVKVTAFGASSESAGYVVVPPAPYLSGNIGAGELIAVTPGTTTALPVSTAEHIGMALFDVPEGKRGMVTLSDKTFGTAPSTRVIGPDGRDEFDRPSDDAVVNLAYDAKPGTYLLVVDPAGVETGRINVLASVGTDVSASVTVDGANAQATTTTPGAVARFSFAAEKGARLYAQASGGNNHLSIGMLDSKGVLLLPGQEFYGRSGYLGPIEIGEKGTYTLVVDPGDAEVGTYSATLTSIPSDAIATMVIDGAATNVTITKPGQKAVVTFAGTAGQRVFTKVGVGGTLRSRIPVRLNAPSGDSVALDEYELSSDDYVDALTLPETGTYKFTMAPGDDYTGTITLRMTSVPTDSVGTATVDGAAGNVTITKPGQNGSITFSAVANQRIFAKVTSSPSAPGCVMMSLFSPNGSPVLTNKCLSTSPDFIDTLELTDAGVHRFVVDPGSPWVGSVALTLTSVPPDTSGAASIGGPAVGVTTTKPGQNSQITFTGSQGQSVTTAVTASTYTNSLSPLARLYKPSGGWSLWSMFVKATSSPETVVLPETGTYRIAIDPNQDDIGSATFKLSLAAGAEADMRGLEDSEVGLKNNPFRKSVNTAPVRLPRSKHGKPRMSYSGARGEVASLSGVVRTTDGAPLARATVSISGQMVRTDRVGRFRLDHLPVGRRVMRLDGRTASSRQRTFGVFDSLVDLRNGRNVLPYVPYLPVLDIDYEIPIESPTKQEVVVTNPAIPGLEVHIPAGVRILDADGKAVRKIGITPIPVDRTPIPMPTGVQVPTYFTVQPAGGRLVGGTAKLVYPNYLKLPASQTVNFWHYDVSGRGWHVYGGGVVDDAGRQVRPDGATRLSDFNGAMINDDDFPQGLIVFLLRFAGWSADPVELGSGLFSMKHVDLAVSDVIPLQVARGYNSGDGRVRPMGLGHNDMYNMFLTSKRQFQEADLNLPDGGQVHFVRTSSGTEYYDAIFEARDTSPEFSGARIRYVAQPNWPKTSHGSWFLRLRNGQEYVIGIQAPVQEIRDVHGNRVTIIREHKNTWSSYIGPITEVRSQNGFWLHYTYEVCPAEQPNCKAKISKIEDNTGRAISYTYEGNLLKTVTGPTGAVTTYGYDSANRLNSITDARAIPYLANVYDANGRVKSQTIRGDGTYAFDYQLSSDGKNVASTTVTEPDGIKRKVTYDSDGYLATDTRAFGSEEEYTVAVERDPDTDLPTKVTDGFGRTTAIAYDPDGNPTTLGAAAGTASAQAKASYGEGPFGQPDTVTDPNNNTMTFKYDKAGRVVESFDPGSSNSAKAKYNVQGQPTQLTSALGDVSTNSYVDGLLLSSTDPLGRKTRYVVTGQVLWSGVSELCCRVGFDIVER